MKRDIEKTYSRSAFIAKLRRLADALAGERIAVPRDSAVSIEHEREGRVEQIEMQVTWKPARC